MSGTDLGNRMRFLADSGHERATELREKAEALDRAAAGFYAEEQTVTVKGFIGAWVRARRLYCDVTGEALV